MAADRDDARPPPRRPSRAMPAGTRTSGSIGAPGEQGGHARPLLGGEPERARRRAAPCAARPVAAELLEPGARTRARGGATASSSSRSWSSSAFAAVGARLLADARDRVRVELREIARRLGQPAPERDGARPPLLERRVVEEGVRPAVEDLVGERRGLGRLAEDGRHGAAPEAVEEPDEPVRVGRLVEAVVHRLAHDRVIRDLDRPRARVLLAAGERREHRGHEVVRLHALDRRRRPAPAALAQHHERAAEVPAPAHLEHRRQEQRLREHLRRVLGSQELRHVLEREALPGTEREHDRVVAGGGLELEVERAGRSACGARGRARG